MDSMDPTMVRHGSNCRFDRSNCRFLVLHQDPASRACLQLIGSTCVGRIAPQSLQSPPPPVAGTMKCCPGSDDAPMMRGTAACTREDEVATAKAAVIAAMQVAKFSQVAGVGSYS